MSFVNPLLAVFGALAISIPVIIHLLRRKRPPINWGAMRFVLEAQRKTKRRTTLERLLLLLTRCVLVGALALGLARPLFGAAGLGDAQRPVTLVIALDNSITSGVRVDGGGSGIENTELAQSIEQARALLDQLSPERGDRAALLTLAAPARAIVDRPSSDLAAIRAALNEIEPTASARDSRNASTLVRTLLTPDQTDSTRDSDRQVLAWLSASRAIDSNIATGTGASGTETSPSESTETESTRAFTVLWQEPASTEAANIGIESVRPRRSVLVSDAPIGDAARITLRRDGASARRGEASQAVDLALESADGQRVPMASTTLTFAAGQTLASAEVVLTPTESLGDRLSLVASLPTDALTADNTVREPIEIRPSLRIVIAARLTSRRAGGLDAFSPADWFEAALQPGAGGMDVRRIDATTLDPPTVAWADAIVLTRPDSIAQDRWTELRTFVERGGLLIITPPSDTTVQAWTDPMLDAMGLDWSIGREALTLDNAEVTVGDPEALRAVATELEELARPVRVSRAVPIESSSALAPLVIEREQNPLPLLVIERAAGGGTIAMFASPPELSWTNLPAMPLMLPLSHELVRQGVTLGSNRARTAPALEATPLSSIRSSEGSIAATADPSGRLDTPISSPGSYEVVNQDGRRVSLYVVNPDSASADTSPTEPDVALPWLARTLGVTESSIVRADGDGSGNNGPIDGEETGAGSVASLSASASAASDSNSSFALWCIAIALAAGLIEVALGWLASRPVGSSVFGKRVTA